MLTPPHIVERQTKLDVAKRELREAIWLFEGWRHHYERFTSKMP